MAVAPFADSTQFRANFLAVGVFVAMVKQSFIKPK